MVSSEVGYHEGMVFSVLRRSQLLLDAVSLQNLAFPLQTPPRFSPREARLIELLLTNAGRIKRKLFQALQCFACLKLLKIPWSKSIVLWCLL